MYKNKKILSIIPARGGSKGIKDKNIRMVGSRPLIDYSIKPSLLSQYIDDTIVSTDSSEIADIAKECGAKVPFLRDDYLATDTAKTIDAVLEVLRKMEQRLSVYDYVVLLQPTQPLRTSTMIDEAIEKIIDQQVDSLVSVSEVNEHPILMRTINEDGQLNNLISSNSTVRRQDFDKVYKVNGTIYINKIDSNFNENTSLNDNLHPFIMNNEWDLDIDTMKDLKMFEEIVSKQLFLIE